MNRITNAIEKMKNVTKNLTKEKIDELQKIVDIDFEEFVKFQDVKSLAFASGVLNLDEAQTIYNLLGSSYIEFNKHSLEVKYVMNQTLKELLIWKLK